MSSSNSKKDNSIKLGAIDIGSNSVRLLITNVIYENGYTYYKKVSMIRIPVRLGQDVFTKGKIGKKTRAKFLEGMRAYRSLLQVHGVKAFDAVATSAMREAKNGPKLVRRIKKEFKIPIRIIDGREEARLIFESKLFDVIQPSESQFIYIDVGGGSTEVSVIVDRQIRATHSFKLGGVRVLNGLDEASEWEHLRNWLAKHTSDLNDVAAIGSGGNINRIQKMRMKPLTDALTYDEINADLERLQGMSRMERMTNADLNADRADVIVHALPIYLEVMRGSGVKKLYVPKIGVSDGLVRDLYHKKYRHKLEG